MANIRKVGADSWKITVSCGRDANNKQIRHYMTWKPDKPMTNKQAEKAVHKAAYEFEKQINLGFQPDNAQTFSEYARYVIELKKRAGITLRTAYMYKYFLERIDDDFGKMRLVDIRPQHINNFYAKLAEPGEKHNPAKCYPLIDFNELVKKSGGVRKLGREIQINRHTITALCRGEMLFEHSARKVAESLGQNVNKVFRMEKEPETLSTATINRYHACIRAIFSQAEKEMIIMYNPAKRATPPKEIKPQKATLQPLELAQVLQAAEGEPLRTQAIINMLAYTGMRCGELCALTWEALDLDNKTVYISAGVSYTPDDGLYIGNTKTGEKRTVPLSDELVSLMRRYKIEYNLERFRLCGAWEDNNLIFCRWNGKVVAPHEINVLLRNFCKKHSELPHLSPHMFRHTAASLMISEGVDVVTVSKILGHKNPTMTLNVYSHEIDLAKENAINCMNDVIRACKLG